MHIAGRVRGGVVSAGEGAAPDAVAVVREVKLHLANAKANLAASLHFAAAPSAAGEEGLSE